MAKEKESKEKKGGQVSDASMFVRNLMKLQTGLRIILYMPKDFTELYEKPLQDRLKHTGIKVISAAPDKLPDEFGNYDRILAYQCPLPALLAEEEPDQAAEDADKRDLHLFEIKGTPAHELMTPFPRKPGFLTDLEFRYSQLKGLIDQLEGNEHFRNLAYIQQNIRLTILVLQQKQTEVDQLVQRLENLDEGYYLILGFYLQQAIDKVLQLVTLGDVMKKYVKVLIIDDMGERTLEQLENQGFRRRFISTMSQQAFNQTFDEFKELYQAQFPDTAVTHHDFFSKCTVFDDYEIIAYNQWKTDKGGLPVMFRLKKSPELSQKEVRKLHEDPKKVASKVNKLNQEQQKAEDQLREVELGLQTAEAKGGVSESAYVGLNKKRKRILRSIKNIKAELDEIQKDVNVRPELTLYMRDFLATIKDKKLAREIITGKGAEGADPSSLKVERLNQLSDLIRQKKKKMQGVRQLNAQVKAMHVKMNEYAGKYPPDPEKPYQQVLGIHTLNKLEMMVLGCGIAKSNHLLQVYPGAYFECRDGQAAISWNSKLLNQVSVHVATKHIKLNTGLITRFFRIKSGDMTGRIENSPALPRSSDFDNTKYGLFVINFNAYPISEIINSLKMRNRSSRPYVPILLVDPMNKIDVSPEKIKLELLLGLKRDGEETIGLRTPTYCIESLEDAEALNFALCELMGIDIGTLEAGDAFDTEMAGDAYMEESPGLGVSEEIGVMDFQPDLDDQEGVQPSAEETESSAKPSADKAPTPVSRRKDDRIKLYLRSEKQEEVYTLGSLFSFSDDVESGGQQKSPPQQSEREAAAVPNGEAPDASEDAADESPRRVDEPLPPVKQKMNPKNPFQF